MPRPPGLKAAEKRLRALALGYPEAYEEFPWGHAAAKVKGSTFAFIAHEKGRLHLSVKLPSSATGALLLPFARPTEYGLGKSGWVTASFDPGDRVPVGLLAPWIDQSYRAIAPKALVARLDAGPSRRPPRDFSGRSSRRK